jgi:putative Mg2+ transporter-C (MgtC) family protein
MELIMFILNVSAALVMGIAIGLERQFRQHPAGLRTNALVCVGAALFVSLSRLLNDVHSPTRIASYIVSGIGFLGGGVIIRDGLNVKGMNTAATLWCSAAVGTLAGAGFPGHALIGTATILALHLGLRPVGRWVDSRLKTAVDVETFYRVRVVCREAQEGIIRTILLRHVNSLPKMTLQGISTQEAERADQAAVVADIFSVERSDREMQDLMSRVNIEPSVASVSWEKVPVAGA